MKKLLTAILAGMILLISLPLANASASPTVFSDLDQDDPSYDAISWMKNHNIVQGYDDGTFQSLNKINRAEFMKIIVESITDEATGSYCFPDVTNEWFAKYVCYGKEIGLINGYEDGYFRPANEINFAEASKIVTNALNIDPATTTSADPWYRQYVEPLSDLSAIPSSISDLDKSIARGEMAEIIYRVEENIDSENFVTYKELEGELIPVESCTALKEMFLDEPDYYTWGWAEEVSEEAADTTTSSSAESTKNLSADSDDYSTTNTQVAGVDEADTIKNDGEYIYMLKNDDTIRIIDAYPAEDMQEVSTIEFDDENTFYPSEIYVDGDQLTVIGSITNYNFDFDYDWDEEPYLNYYHQSRTGAYIYDITDRSAPTLTRQLEFDGDYSDSRKIDNTLYLIMQKFDLSYYYYGFGLDDLNVEEILPRYYDSAQGEEKLLANCTDLKYLPQERDLNYLITVAVPLDDVDGAIDSEVIIGDSGTTYSSTDNLYIASINYDYSNYYYDWSNAKTLVHKFALGESSIEYENSGKVPGTILNQFSLDEYNDNLRIATTEGSWWSGDAPENNLFILDENLDTVGSVEGLAPGEEIYSTRFMGDTGYIVTFEKVDPLFVLDLSDPTAPRVTGELKVPGYSDYLHPWGDDYLIGFGEDADDAEEEEEAARDLNFSWYQGMKMSLFDVSDMSNPTQVDSEGIGDRGTYSELLYNHKALLFSDSLSVLAFPATVAIVEDPETPSWEYGDYVFQGAYVYNFNENGFDILGTITHYDDNYDFQNYWYGEKDIERIIYIGDNLYSISDGMIMANNINTLDEINSIELN